MEEKKLKIIVRKSDGSEEIKEELPIRKAKLPIGTISKTYKLIIEKQKEK